MSEQTLEVNNNKVNVKMTRSKGLQIKCNIDVLPDAVREEYSKAIKAVNKEVSLPGFRKGRAPEEVIVKNYEKQINSHWREFVINTGFQEAMQLLRIRPYREDVRCTEFTSISKDEGAKFTLEFEAAPAVPLLKVEDIHLPHVERKPVTEAAVDRSINHLRLQHAQWLEVNDKPVHKGDYVDLDIEKIDPPEKVCEGTRFEIDHMAPWMQKLLIGQPLNAVVEGMSEPDPKQDTTHFQPTECRITIKKILQPMLPELNQEFAKKIGLPEITLLREKVMGVLNQQADKEMRKEMYFQLDQILLQKYPFEIPQSILQTEVDMRLESAQQQLNEQGVAKEAAEQYLHSLQHSLPEQVERAYHLTFLLMAFARHHNISVSEQEVAKETMAYMLSGHDAPRDPQGYKALTEKLSQQMLLERTRDYIIDHSLRG